MLQAPNFVCKLGMSFPYVFSEKPFLTYSLCAFRISPKFCGLANIMTSYKDGW